MAWSDEARAAAAAARRAHAHAKGSDHQARRARALASHVPARSAMQAIGRAQEQAVARAVRAPRRLEWNSPMDVVKQVAGRLHGIEVKTLIKNTNDKITTRKAARLRKLAWAAENHARLHTVAVDARRGGSMYYHAGVGSFRLGSFKPVSSGAELRRLVYGGR